MKRNILLIGGGLALIITIMTLANKKEVEPQVAVAQEKPRAADGRKLYAKALQMKKERNIVEAKKIYQNILQNHNDLENINTIQQELEEINMDMIFSNVPYEGKAVFHEVVSGDTLGKLARKYGVTVGLIQRSNNLKGDVIRIGQKLRIWQGAFNIFVDKSQNILILKDSNEVIKTYNVSTGINNSTPVGAFKITSKLTDPVWFNRGVVVPPESPDNVLGTRWLGFDLPGYGIHGTVEPDAIGKQVTAGCVRMRNQEVEELYTLIPMGTEVTIVD